MPKTIRSKLPPVRSEVEWLGTEIASFCHPTDDRTVSTLRLWVELPAKEVVGFVLGEPGTLPPFADTFLEVARKPMTGRPRLPGSARLADPQLAAELEGIAGLPTRVRNTPTPEMDELVTEMTKALRVMAEEHRHPASGTINPKSMTRLFTSSAMLYKRAHWKAVRDDQVVQVGIPDLGIHEACLSILGNADESFGFLLFPSFDDYWSFVEDSHEFLKGDDVVPTSSWLALNFVPRGDLPPGRLEEAKRHRWPVAGPRAYPDVIKFSGGKPSVVEEHDVTTVACCAGALVALVTQNGPAMFSKDVETTPHLFTGSDGITVKLSHPVDSPFEFDLREPEVRHTAKVGRNDPCPCGSGKKFKKCCIHKEQSAPASQSLIEDDETPSVHEMDERLVVRILDAAFKRFGRSVQAGFNDFDDARSTLQLAMPYMAYCFAIDGVTMVEVLLDDQKSKLSSRERGWLEAQRRAWLSIWEIEHVEPGIALTLVDLLTGERRRALENIGSRTARKRDTLLARIVDFEDKTVVCGSHTHALPPAAADNVVAQVRAELKGNLSTVSLQKYDVCREVLMAWEDQIDASFEASMQTPSLSNTDGDPLWFTVDRFHFDPADLPEIESRLSRIKDVIPPDDSDERVYIFERPGKRGDPLPSTTTGEVRFDGNTLAAETNSIKRADALRKKLEAACGDLLVFEEREGTDPQSVDSSREPSISKDEIPEAIRHEIIREFKKKHYATWPDEHLPALQGKTPREAAQSAEGRRQLSLLLKGIEHSEQSLHP